MRNKKGQFVKGSKVWNKGLKGFGYRFGFGVHKKFLNTGRTRFKKGNKSWNKGSGTTQKCEICKKDFYFIGHRKRRFCSRVCLFKSFIGKGHPRWKHGKGTERERIHNTKKYRTWRETVFKRDNWTCQDCGKRGVYVEAHHIKQWSKYPKLRFIIKNGQTLCRVCHNKTKKW
jgi:hypothetical protein